MRPYVQRLSCKCGPRSKNFHIQYVPSVQFPWLDLPQCVTRPYQTTPRISSSSSFPKHTLTFVLFSVWSFFFLGKEHECPEKNIIRGSGLLVVLVSYFSRTKNVLREQKSVLGRKRLDGNSYVTKSGKMTTMMGMGKMCFCKHEKNELSSLRRFPNFFHIVILRIKVCR